MLIEVSWLNTQYYMVRIKGSGAIQGLEYCPILRFAV